MRRDSFYRLNPEEVFVGLCLNKNNKESSIKLFKILPKKVRKKLEFHEIHITDWFDKSINPNIAIDGERLAYFIEKGRAIYITPKNIFSEEAIMGLLAHEIAHVYLFYSHPLKKIFLKIYYKIKLNHISSEEKSRYKRHYQKREWIEEYQADSLVRKWGFKEFQETLWKEMSIKTG